ncbi:MAG: hypothetical protein HDS72_04605 [Bacteroidales bacterium]|nr:hypothetical protein [Bacteroidales bacterium]
MATFLVHVRPRQSFNSEQFIEHMRDYPHWAQLMTQLWMVSYDGSATQLRDNIASATQKTCEIIIINITGDGWATLNIDRGLTDWMTENV